MMMNRMMTNKKTVEQNTKLYLIRMCYISLKFKLRWLYSTHEFEDYMYMLNSHMSHVMRKPAFGFSDQVRHKQSCTATEDGQRLEISDLERKGIVLSM